MGTPPPNRRQQLLAYTCRAATWSCRFWDSLLSLFRFLELCVIWTSRSEICLNRNNKKGETFPKTSQDGRIDDDEGDEEGSPVIIRQSCGDFVHFCLGEISNK